MERHVTVELVAWNRFHSRNLLVAPQLLGQSHTFTFDGTAINIALPSADRLAGFYTGEGRFVDDRLSVSGWREEDGRRQPLQVHVHDVDVVVSIPGETSVPDEARTRPINAYELFSEQQQKRLEELASDHGNIARRSFDLWIRTLRWQADDWQIGMPEMYGAETGWSTYIKEKNTQKDLWAAEFTIDVRGGKTVTPVVWEETAAVLNSGQSPPIFYDLLYDATIHLDRGDLQRAVVDTALAAETYMRTIVHEGLPPDLDAPIRKYIDRAQISRVSSEFFPARLDSEQKKQYSTLKSDLNNLANPMCRFFR